MSDPLAAWLQADVLAFRRDRAGLWGLCGELLPVESKDRRRELNVVDLRLQPRPRGGSVLALNWRLTTFDEARAIVDVREQWVGCCIIPPTLPDPARSIEAIANALRALTAGAEVALTAQPAAVWPAHLLGTQLPEV
ncbi:MAG: hypothetical protein U0228_27940 [Myxococcaceae bacterium]